MQIKGIDVSYHNGVINWELVKNSGVKFAMLRCGYGRKDPRQIDKNFERNYTQAKKAGLPVGVYHYSYATTIEAAEAEADFVLELIKGKQFEYPVIYDVEDKTQKNLSKALLTDIIKVFCEKLENAGYYVGFYSNRDWLTNRLITSELSAYDLWLAEWRTTPLYKGKFGMWQYTDNGHVDGINGAVDMNYSFKDYPTIIKKAGLNGYGNKLFTVTGSINGLDSDEADRIKSQLLKMGFKAVSKRCE